MNTLSERKDLINPSTKLTVELTVQEFNTILAALQEMPHRMVDELLKNIMKQAESQVQK